MEFVFTV